MLTVTFAGYHAEEENYERIRIPEGTGEYALVYFLTPMQVYRDAWIEDANPGACVLFSPTRPMDFSAVREFSYSFVRFTASSEEIKELALPLNFVFYPGEPEKMDRFFDRIHREYFTKDLGSAAMAAAITRELLVFLARGLQDGKMQEIAGKNLFKLFLEARFTMLSNCEKEWASTNMCEMLSMSRSQFYKYYQDFFGISPMEDVNNARIEKAKLMLRNRETSVTAVAAACGYASIHHFSRTFKEHTGMSPVAYVRSISPKAH